MEERGIFRLTRVTQKEGYFKRDITSHCLGSLSGLQGDFYTAEKNPRSVMKMSFSCEGASWAHPSSEGKAG